MILSLGKHKQRESNSVAEEKWDNRGQYSEKRIRLYEQIFGGGYISSGGHITTEQLCLPLQNLTKDARVLDIGSGIGGTAFFLESQYGCIVTGVDLCEDMCMIAEERSDSPKSSVNFLLGDILHMDFPSKSFDVIISRDTLLHLSETKKRKLFAKCIEWLDDNGEIIIGDYCRRPKNESICRFFEAYVADREYDLHDPFAYGKLLEDAGFKKVVAWDVSDDFLKQLETELALFRKECKKRPKHYEKEGYEHIEKSWLKKIEWVRSGDMRKGVLYGRRG